ncbi:hypothetical protein TPB0596_09880 [Tsukamurella pulmonis]|uniref:hypothetical protein n=1 Tax=Tsukamurella pulmonis TaxID=47312 RepID=UPI001EDD330B|nr:hypothetical protein [Tsukamurella pulmonis]BDD81225.1 hypothetical protein TPB0596_09880 [Tsukamurella pulmonis]
MQEQLEVAASRMGLPTPEFRTPFAQQILAGDCEDLVRAYMRMIEIYNAGTYPYGKRYVLGVGLLTEHSQRLDDYTSGGDWWHELAHVLPEDLRSEWVDGKLIWACEVEHFFHRADSTILPIEFPTLVVEFLAWLVFIADGGVPSGTRRHQRDWRYRSRSQYGPAPRPGADDLFRRRRETARAAGPTAARAQAFLSCIAVFDAAFDAGWLVEGGGKWLCPPPGVTAGRIRLSAIHMASPLEVKRFAAKLRRAGVAVPNLTTEVAA